MTAPIQIQEQPNGVTRRKFIKGVIAAGAAVSASSYLFRGPEQLFGQGSLPGAVERLMTLTVNGQQRPRRRDEAGNARDDAALQARPHRNEARLRSFRMRRLHGAHRRRAALLVLGPDAHGAQQEGRHRSKASSRRTASCIRCSRRSSTNRASSARSACPGS